MPADISVNRPQLLFSAVLFLIVAGAAARLLLAPAGSQPQNIAALESAIERYRFAGYLETPVGFAGGVPPYRFSLESYQGLAELYLWHCLQRINQQRGTQLQSISFNGPISKDVVNVYFVRKDPDDIFQSFQNNCAYIGQGTFIIVCDAAYVEGLRHQPAWLKDLHSRQNSKLLAELRKQESKPDTSLPSVAEWKEILDDAREASDRQVIAWVLGHEMGHLARGDRLLHFSFASDSSKTLIRVRDSGALNEEIEADRFALESADERLIAEPLAVGLESAVGRFGAAVLIAEGQSADLWNSDVKVIVKQDSETHPPLFVRAINMLSDLTRKFGFGDAERIERLRKRVVVVN